MQICLLTSLSFCSTLKKPKLQIHKHQKGQAGAWDGAVSGGMNPGRGGQGPRPFLPGVLAGLLVKSHHADLSDTGPGMVL